MENSSKVISIFWAIVLLSMNTIVISSESDSDESFCITVPDGKDGVCISIDRQLRYCPKLRNYLKNKNQWELLRQSVCSSNIKNGRVCCPLEGTDSYQEDTRRVREPDYSKHKNFKLFLLSRTRCGIARSVYNILGGKDATLGQFPWMARIGYLQTNNVSIFTCSGTIINENYILTSAHCLLPYKQGYKLAPIRLAENDDSKNPELSPAPGQVPILYKDFDIEDVIVHPNYTGNKTSPHDIALIRLKNGITNLTTDYYARAICLPFVKAYKIGKQLDELEMVRQRNDNKAKMFRPIIAGWGKTDNDNINGSSILQYLDVPVQPSILCRIHYANTNFSDKHLCIGGEENKASCWGDSGGPLMFNAVNENEISTSRKYQIGIVSYGRSECGKQGVPVVYTRLRDYLSWILDTVKE